MEFGKYRVSFILGMEFIILLMYMWTLNGKGTVNYFINGSEIYADTQEGEVYTNVLKRETSDIIQNLRTRGITLDKGIYNISIWYKASGNGTAGTYGQTLNTQSMWSDTVTLTPNKEEVSFQVWINDKTDGFGIVIGSDGEELSVNDIRIKTASNSKLYLVVCLLVKLLAADGILFGIMFRRELQKYSVQIGGILGITVICSMGLFTRYLTFGHDMVFHMNRIEGLKDGLLSGAFPVRIQPTWNYGWGYAVSVMYGDLMLIFPALMRMIGFTLQTTWKTFILAVNLLTAVISFYSFYNICRNKYKALFASLLYCTGMYRLACIYVRAAVGEFTVMMFLPLVVLGFWYAFEEDVSKEEYGKHIIAPVIGFTGMIQTHVLTCEICALFIIILCIYMIKKVLRRKTFLYFSKIAIFTILINLWFLVPFIRYMGEDLVVSQMAEMRDDFQTWGLSIAELFAASPSRAYGFTFGENVSLANKCTFSVGLALWGSAAAGLMLLWNKEVKKIKAAALSLSFGLIAAFMATNLFPYEWIKKWLPSFAVILSKIQFSYRFLGAAALFFTLTILFALMEVKKRKLEYLLTVWMIVFSVLAVYQGLDYQYQILYGGSCENKYSAAVLDSADVVSGEYLYQNSSVEIKDTVNEITGNGIEIYNASKEYLNAMVVCRAVREGAYIEIPAFYYPGYTAIDKERKEYKVLRSENNNRIRVELPEGFDGTLYIAFREPVYWRICEAVSLLALAVLLFHRRIESRRKRIGEECDA